MFFSPFPFLLPNFSLSLSFHLIFLSSFLHNLVIPHIPVSSPASMLALHFQHKCVLEERFYVIKTTFLKLHILIDIFISLCVWIHLCIECLWKPENILQTFLLSFLHIEVRFSGRLEAHLPVEPSFQPDAFFFLIVLMLQNSSPCYIEASLIGSEH